MEDSYIYIDPQSDIGIEMLTKMTTPRDLNEQDTYIKVKEFNKDCYFGVYVFGDLVQDEQLPHQANFQYAIFRYGTVLQEGTVLAPEDGLDGTFIYRPGIKDLGRTVRQMLDDTTRVFYLSHCGEKCNPVDYVFEGMKFTKGGRICKFL